MIKISHRANLRGSSDDKNSNPVDAVLAISKGYDVELDIWMNEKGMFLGHDEPTYEIDETFIEDMKENVWFHCKNIEALGYFVNNMPDAKFFWHENDSYTLTSNGYIWTYPGQTVTNKSIIVLTEPMDLNLFRNAYGVCTDYLD